MLIPSRIVLIERKRSKFEKIREICGNYSGGCKAMYRTLLEGVWLSDIGRMAEVRNVPHLACKV